MGRTIRAAIPALCLIAVSFLPASAAGDDPLQPPDLEEYLRWGVLRVRPGFSVSNFGYDDNVFHQSASPQGDTTLTLTPRMEGLLLLGSRGFLKFTESVDYTVYRKYGELNTLDHAGRYRLTVPLGDFGLFFDAEAERFHERPVDLVDERAIRNSTLFGAGAIVRLGWRTALELERSRRELSYTDEDFGNPARTIGDVKDRVETSREVRASYRLFGRARLTLELADRDMEFDNPMLGTFPGSTRNLEQRTLLPGVDFGVGGALSGTVRLGVTRLDYDDPNLNDYRGAVGNAALTYRLKRAWRFTLDGERRIDFSVWENNSYLVYSHRGLRATRFVNRYFGIEAGFSRGSVEIPEPVSGPARKDRLRTWSVGMVAQLAENGLGRKTEYAIRLTDRDQDSSDPALSRSRTTLSLSVNLGF